MNAAAKKSAGEPKVAGRGQKACPACGEVLGARQRVCPNCNHAFEMKAATGSRKTSNDGMAAIKAAVQFIGECGGVEEAKSQLADMVALLVACGGTAEALAAIEQVELIQNLGKKK